MIDKIDRKRLLSLFESLVSIDSPSFGEREMGDFVTEKLSCLGIAALEDAAAAAIGGNCGNLHALLSGVSSTDGSGDVSALPPLLLCAHLDTVEPSGGKRMQMDEQGVITSAGDTVLGADDCAGIAAILEALTVLKESGLPHRPIELLFTAAEEPYCTGAKALDLTALQSKEAYVFDLSGPVGGAAYAAPTIVSFQAEFTGRSAHAGFAPEDGIHAIAAAGRAVSEISCGRIGISTRNIGTITGGTANNIVPDRCTLTGEIRSGSNEEALQLFTDTCLKLEAAAAAFGATVDVEHTVHIKAYRTDLEDPVARRFASVCDTLNLDCCFQQTFGGSDLNVLAQHGIRGLVVANAMNNCHSTSEFTTEDELARAAGLALALMLSAE